MYSFPSLLGTTLRDYLSEIKKAAQGFRVVLLDDEAEIVREIEDAEVFAGFRLSSQALARAQRLKWYHTWAAGVDHVLTPELLASQLIITSSKGNGGVYLAEHAIMLMLMLSREAPRYFQLQQERRWASRFHDQLEGKTVGIIGLGNCGADLALKCKAFHMRVLGLRRSSQWCEYVDQAFTRESLHDFLKEADFVVVTAPLTNETKDMLGEPEFLAMKRSAYFIVVSRGGIAQDQALLRALREGWIAGAGLDAHSVEPLPPDSPFWTAPNTIITPHCGATSFGLRTKTLGIFMDNLKRYMHGLPLMNVVDKDVGY